MSDQWRVWYGLRGKMRGKAKGVFVVHRASDSALELQQNGLDDRDREEYCERLCEVLNKAKQP